MTLDKIPRYAKDRTTTLGQHAVVIGGSMGGLITGRILADYYEEVTILERDDLSKADENLSVRNGVPQGDHVHVMMEGVRSTVNDLLPGFGEEILKKGALLKDFGGQHHTTYQYGGVFEETAKRKPTYSATRPLFERTVRKLVAEYDGIVLRDRCHFKKFLTDESNPPNVVGAKFKDEDNNISEIQSDLVVDATGRTSNTPGWLESHGYRSPPVDRVTVDLAYCTGHIKRPPGDRRSVLVTPSPSEPQGHKTGTIFPVEDDRWEATIIGMVGDHPPTNIEGIREFASDMPSPEMNDILNNYEVIDKEFRKYPFPSNQRRRYEKLNRFPNNLIVIGDAITSFNPIYGQGMSVAALEALQLHNTLAEVGQKDLALNFFNSVKKIIDIPWFLAVTSDFSFDEVEGDRPPGVDLVNWYDKFLTQAARDNEHVSDSIWKVRRFEKSLEELAHPDVVSEAFKTHMLNNLEESS